MAISEKVRQQMTGGSWIRRMFEEGIALRQRYGDDKVFDLSLGNPVLEPPPEFREELGRLAHNPIPGMHRYMPNAGYPESRAAVAAQLAAETGLGFTANEIVMTCGAGGGINVVFKAILNPGDEVIVLAPYFVEYLYYADNHGGQGVAVPTDSQFQPDLAAIEAAIGPRTRAILLNSPNNPTGVVYSAEVLARLGDLARAKEQQHGTSIYLVSDEPYRKLIYDGLSYPFIYPYHPRSIAVTSHSKDLGLPGERIGYIAVNPDLADHQELVDALIFANRILGFVNAPALMQRLVARIQGVTVDIAHYQRQRDRLYDALTAAGYSLVKPQGAFYMFPQSPLPDDVHFVRELQKHGVLTVPGSGFGTPGYFRIAYCVDERTLEGAIAGLQKAARLLA